MPLAFSFFSSKSSSQPSPAGPEVLGAQQVNESPESTTLPSPFPVNQPLSGQLIPQEIHLSQNLGDDAETVLLAKSAPTPFPQPAHRPTTGGLAALALNQSEMAAPPLNKRLSLLPGTAIPATAARPTEPVVFSHPPVPHELDSLRQELQTEIEQVKNDLFGAVMGVSALKDRLDGLEVQVQQAPSAPQSPSRNELESWMVAWLEDHLAQALERALTPVLQKFSSQGLLRLPIPPAELNASLSQAPVILTSTPV